MSGEKPLVDVRIDGAVAIVTLDRPEKRNALDIAMRSAIAAAFETLDREDAVRCIVVVLLPLRPPCFKPSSRPRATRATAPSPWLVRRVALKLPLTTPEAAR